MADRVGKYHTRLAETSPPAGISGPCWLWTGRLTSSGYGPHRKIYESETGQRVPEDAVLDHRCRRRTCCNPDHLEVVTRSVNERRKPGHQSGFGHRSCPRGHGLVGANKVPGGGCRRCNELSRGA